MAKRGRPVTCTCGVCPKCKHREYHRGWYQKLTPEERRAAVARRDPEAVRRSEAKRYQKRKGTPAIVANYTANNAVRDGKLIPQPCEICGAKAEKHHDDYSKPLEVRWLCRGHHKALHEGRL